MNNGICIHERPPRSKLGLNLARLGSQIINWEKEFFCKECNWFVGYYSKIISRNTLHSGGSTHD